MSGEHRHEQVGNRCAKEAGDDGCRDDGLVQPVAEHERDHHADRGGLVVLNGHGVIRLALCACRLRWLTRDGDRPNASVVEESVTYREVGGSGRETRSMLSENALKRRSGRPAWASDAGAESANKESANKRSANKTWSCKSSPSSSDDAVLIDASWRFCNNTRIT